MPRIPRDCLELIHALNRRCRDEFRRAEHLQAELDHIRGSRLWPLFSWLRRLRGTERRTARKPTTYSNEPGELLDDCRVPPAGMVSIIIPFKNQLGLLRHCLRSIARSNYRSFEIVLVDNGSTEPRLLSYVRRLARCRRVRLVSCPEPFNFARLSNQGAAVARGDWLLFLNNDTEVLTADWLERLLEIAGHPRIGVVGATLLFPDGTIQHAGIGYIGDGFWKVRYQGQPPDARGDHGELAHIRAAPAVTGACLVVGRPLFAELGGFDERFPSDYNDVDLCCRVAARGLAIAITPHARLLHFTGLSRGFNKASRYYPPADKAA